MSKNVAIFVDVANIFYAAKAAGVDIDYVTLLKASTAGRDFVRAYAYTGLDPENENQRQFHSFLTRSGYKVVSKDIRKYGDGRIKANLDIELVVDLMRMAQHVDIAVVVSGDGDFAPAIRAVQQQGVRVEVVSFRGNTSSDLIEVADVFTDISQLARVERGERSGRRVAAEDDLSMTAVPEKETDTGGRRRRGDGRRGDRADRGSGRRPAEPAEASNLIVLPGERLSRVAPGDAGDTQELAEDVVIEPAAVDGAEDGVEQGEGRRRRRRRGGRGRGRGRRGEGEGQSASTAEGEAPEDVAEDELLEEEVAPLPQHSTFGSVWESQIGVAPSAPSMSASIDDEDAYDDEPEIPEYLLAERRQQGRGGRNRGGRQGQGRGQGGYRSAIDRERYGRTGGAVMSGFGRDRSGGQGRSQGRGQSQPRPQAPAQPRPAAPAREERQAGAAEPWSEVPADVQELLRAELARRQAAGTRPGATARKAAAAEAPAPEPAAEPAPEAPAKPTRRRTTKAAAAEAPAPEPAAEPAPEAPAKPTRRRTTKAAAAEAPAPEPAAEPAPEAPAKPTRRRTTKAAAAEAPAPEPAAEPAPEAPAKPTRRRTTKAAATVGEG
ncbi:MAG: NYN domain-containing protein [Chloroflexota bacterium]